MISGPFSFGVSLGNCAEVLRIALGLNTPISLFSAPEPSLFSVWPAGRLRRGANKINHLRSQVCCQLWRAIRRQTREPSFFNQKNNTVLTAFGQERSDGQVESSRSTPQVRVRLTDQLERSILCLRCRLHWNHRHRNVTKLRYKLVNRAQNLVRDLPHACQLGAPCERRLNVPITKHPAQ